MAGEQFRQGAGYMVFMLRMWQETGKGGETWRFSLEDPSTRQKRGFEDLEGLVAFLKDSPKMAHKGVAEETTAAKRGVGSQRRAGKGMGHA